MCGKKGVGKGLLAHTCAEIERFKNKDCDRSIREQNLHHSWLSTALSSKKEMLLKVREGKLAFVESVKGNNFHLSAVSQGKEEGYIRKTRKRKGDGEGQAEREKRTEFLRRLVRVSIHMVPSGSGVYLGRDTFLTCAHCLEGDCDEVEEGETAPPLLGRLVDVVDSNGSIFVAECVAVDAVKDVAVLSGRGSDFEGVESVRVTAPLEKESVCVCGNPYDWDLEREKGAAPRNNGFKPFHCSFGRVEKRGVKMEGLGGMIHSCWTYWGHSGAPVAASIREGGEGMLCVGIHNSWNDLTSDRHGVDGKVIAKFLRAKGFGSAVEGEGGGGVEEEEEEGEEVIDLTYT